jgi:mRNA interferase HicA
MNGRQFIARVRKWARGRDLEVRFVASEGPGSHGTLYAGDRKTTVKDRKKDIGKGLLAKMLADLGIDRDDFQAAERRKRL